MRIIAGKYRRRKLHTPRDAETTRPIPDRVKESVFSLLRGNIEDARVIDAFAGTGSIGLEALSRGARECVFFEKDRRAAELLERNIEELGAEEEASVVRGDALGPAVLTRAGAMGGVDLLFFDPPYPLVRDGAPGGGWERVKRQLERLVPHLSDQGFLVLRTPWPFRHVEMSETEAAAAHAHAPRERRGLPEGKRLEKEWIGDEIDIEAIERDTERLKRRLDRETKRGGDIDPGRAKPGMKRHLTERDLDEVDFEDERIDDIDSEDEEEAHDGAPRKYHMVDLGLVGAVGPETHVYGSTAVHLYMKKRDRQSN